MGPPYSLQIPRVCRYSGYWTLSLDFVYETITLFGNVSHRFRLSLEMLILVRTLKVLLPLVWPASLSLATTREISVDFSSSSYLDVSVQRVPFINLCIQLMIYGSSPYVFPHSEIHGYNAYLQLPVAYRSLSRLSSAPDAKAFSLCSCLLELLLINITWILVLGSLFLFKNC